MKSGFVTDIASYFKGKNGQVADLLKAVRDRKNISAFNMSFADKTIISSLVAEENFPLIYVCSDFVMASKAAEQFGCIFKDVVYLPAKDDTLSFRKSQSGESEQKRLMAMVEIVMNRARIVVTTAQALIQLYPDKNRFKRSIISLEKNKDYNVDAIVKGLVFSGYKREAQVVSKGQFSIRGDILDLWPPNVNSGIRLEFFGDLLEEIKLFDIGEQTALESLGQIEICPNTEIFLSDDEAEKLAVKVRESAAIKSKNQKPDYVARAEGIISEICLKLIGGERDFSLSYILPLCPFMNFEQFFESAIVVYDEAKQTVDNISVLYTEHENRFKSLLERGEVFPFSFNQLISKEKALNISFTQIAFHSLTSQNRIFNPEAVFDIKTFNISSYARNYQGLCDDINNWMEQDYHIVLFCGSAGVKENMRSLLSENNVGHDSGGNGNLSILEDELNFGAVFHDEKLVFIGTYNIVNKSVKKTIKRKKGDVFVEPSVGSYVVHNIHGIGFCESVKRLDINGASKDYFVVRYQGDDKLYVPIENMDSLTKFVSGEENPKLSKIGGADFAKAKDKVKSSVKEMAFSLLELYAQRQQSRGYKYSDENVFLNEFCSDFPFTETDDQLDATAEAIKDLTDGKIMDRLLCGDVGYGKTEVALRVAFKVITEGKQVAFISPTTILAKQHFNTVKQRMESFGVRIGSLTRFDSSAEISKTLSDVASGKIDIVVGTHRVLSGDVKFKDLGLLILDEEQRFGVADKEKIKNLKVNVNILTLSATPIPRTLHMSMVGIRDISVLDTPPAMRIPIQTYVSEYTESLVIDAMMREVNRGGQVFIVYNRVESIEKFAAGISSLAPSLKIFVAHGQMQENKLENVISGFIAGEADVLIATTIIENGIDMPKANTMIVVDSDRFGLSQLYQLRGRVGRSDKLAYVYFTYNGAKMLTDTAYKRLEAITEYTEFGSGFKIAMRDLEIRGAGNILGREQHGHIEKVGYDMYCKLLENAVGELSGNGVSSFETEVKVNTDFNAFIPENYIEDNEWRIRVYSRISTINTNKERISLMGDLTDIYGKPPSSVENLILIALVKNLAAKINAQSVTLKKTQCCINFAKTLDIPKTVVERAGKRLDMLKCKIDFGGARGEMIKFLYEA